MSLRSILSKIDITEDVWSYVTRRLTSLAVPDDIIKFLGKGTGTEVPSNKSIYDLIALDRWDVRLPAARAALIDQITDIIKFLGKGTGTEVPSNKSIYDLIALDRWDVRLPAARAALIDQITAARMAELDPANLPADVATNLAAILTRLTTAHFDLSELETEWQSDPVVQNVASAAATALTAGSITPTYPTGAVERRVILLPMIKAASQAANTHHIGFKIQYRTGGAGPYSDLKDYTANPPLTLAAVDGATDSWAQPIDVSAIVSSGVQVEFRFEVDSDSAGSVNYTSSFLLVLVYRMG